MDNKKTTRVIIKTLLIIPLALVMGACLEAVKKGSVALGIVPVVLSGVILAIYNYVPKERSRDGENKPKVP